MLIRGEWSPCDDGVDRPVIHGEMKGAAGIWKSFPFLVDTGADRTVLSASALALLRSVAHGTSEQISGVGGNIEAILISAEILLAVESGAKVGFRGEFAAIERADELDICVLGRDVTESFAVIVDRPGNIVCLIMSPHGYTIAVTRELE